MSNIPSLSEEDVVFLMKESKHLKYLQLYGTDDQKLTSKSFSRILGLARDLHIYIAASTAVS